MLGKLPPKRDSRTIKFKTYLTEAHATPPTSADYTKAVRKQRWPVFANDHLPCCTCSAAGHMIQVWSANVGKERILPDAAIIRAYEPYQSDVHKPRKHLLDILNHWRKKGIGGHKILGYAQLQLRNRTEVKQAISMLGACYIGLALPDFAAHPPTLTHFRTARWTVPRKGRSTSSAPRRKNGHCVAAFKYDSENLYVVTWGKAKRMTWDFYETYMEEAFAVVSREFTTKRPSVKSAHLNLTDLKRDVRSTVKQKNKFRK